MSYSCNTILLAMVLSVCVLTARASADVKITIIPDQTVVEIGETFNISVFANMSLPIVGWGLDLEIDDEMVLFGANPPTIASPWLGVASPDGDDFAALAFPDPIAGNNILLATIPIFANSAGTAFISVGATPGDLTEGFALVEVGAFDTFFVNGATIEVIPGPGAFALLGFAALAMHRRSRV